MRYQEILDFWFEKIQPEAWWTKDEAFDRYLSEQFGKWVEAAARCELDHWRNAPKGRLAEIILLDQFTRNIYRDTPRAFAADPLALGLAQEAIASGAERKLSITERRFLYMPFMHSESRRIHERAERLFQQLGLPEVIDYEARHKRIIDRFGRYPHRNAILGRESTAEELAFLQEPGSSF